MDWLNALRARANCAPAAARDPLYANANVAPIGSVEPALVRRMVAAGMPLAKGATGWRIIGTPLNDAFAQIAEWLRAEGLASAWRGELLAVTDASGATLGAIERAAVRPLGIATHAVHLVGRAEQGGIWVQQRALDKATDPGQWDTLMGGLMSAGETIATTLQRETWEEAGLHTADLHELAARGVLTVRRPVSNGYMVEHIHMFDALVPARLAPLNQDGEVAAFDRLDLDALHDRLRGGAFTLEAALILADVLVLDATGTAPPPMRRGDAR